MHGIGAGLDNAHTHTHILTLTLTRIPGIQYRKLLRFWRCTGKGRNVICGLPEIEFLQRDYERMS